MPDWGILVGGWTDRSDGVEKDAKWPAVLELSVERNSKSLRQYDLGVYSANYSDTGRISSCDLQG